jgi:peptidoglycan DL-endopeptidase CwlO
VPQIPRLRALAAATLAALVIVTIQPPVPGAAETPTPSASPTFAAPAIVAPSPTPTPTPSPVAAPIAAPIAVESPVPAAPAAEAAPVAAPDAAAALATAPARKRTRTAPKADRVIAAAMAKRGRPWVYGATGPRAFDCSGLVTYAFRRAGVLAQIGSGRNRGGSSMLRWARAHHLTRTIGHRGDVVVWGNGAHVGIYLGRGRAISTLTSGVRVHGLRVLNTRFTTFIGTGLWMPGRAARAIATTTPAATGATTGVLEAPTQVR